MSNTNMRTLSTTDKKFTKRLHGKKPLVMHNRDRNKERKQKILKSLKTPRLRLIIQTQVFYSSQQGSSLSKLTSQKKQAIRSLRKKIQFNHSLRPNMLKYITSNNNKKSSQKNMEQIQSLTGMVLHLKIPPVKRKHCI